MSFNRENVVWESKDGRWNRGFYEVVWTDPDGDPEWDVEYGSDFEWVSTGHMTEERAERSWDGANPGGHYVVRYAGNEAECDGYDEKARRCKAEQAEREKQYRDHRTFLRF